MAERGQPGLHVAGAALASSSASASTSPLEEEKYPAVTMGTVKFAFPRTLADRVGMPWHWLLWNPALTLVGYVVFNVVFISIGLLISLLVALLTLPGLFLVTTLALIAVVRHVALCAVFPGQLQLVTREGERTFARLLIRRMASSLDALQDWARCLRAPPAMPALSSSSSSSTPTMMRRSAVHSQRRRLIQLHDLVEEALDSVLRPLHQALTCLHDDHTLHTNGGSLLTALSDLLALYEEELLPAYRKLMTTSSTRTTTEFEQLQRELFGVVSSARPASESMDTIQQTRLVTEVLARTDIVRELLPLLSGEKDSDEEAAQGVQAHLPRIGRALWPQPQRQEGDRETTAIVNLDLMRADLASRFNGKQVWITSQDGHKIDAMFIPAATAVTTATATSSPSSATTITTTTGGSVGDQNPHQYEKRPVMLLCNPNGGLYEFHHIQMDWIPFYTARLHCHVLVFNYRGYGRNTGAPSPHANRLDALAIVDYLVRHPSVESGAIGVHGESIGGLVATALAKSSPHIAVLIADRTFANLPALAQRLVAHWAGPALHWLTWWHSDSVGDFLSARCAKLVCSDPEDEVIVDAASLKSGIAMQLELGDHTCAIPKNGVLPPSGSDAGDGDDGDDEEPVESVEDDAKLLPGGMGEDDSIAAKAARMPGTLAHWVAQTSHRVCTKEAAKVHRRTMARARTRRVSEADSRPELGQPLTEAAVRRFSDAALSLGRRAMKYVEHRDSHRDRQANKKATPTKENGDVRTNVDASTSLGTASEDQVAISISSGNATATLAVSGEVVAMAWMQLAAVDGYCGQCFLQAAEHGGYDRIRAWTVSLLTWGSQLRTTQERTRPTLAAFDRQGLRMTPVPIMHVHAWLQRVAEENPNARFDLDLGVVIQMVEYLVDTLQRRWQRLDEVSGTKTQQRFGENNDNNESVTTTDLTATTAINRDEDGKIASQQVGASSQAGQLLTLHCGHNKRFDEREKSELTQFLRSVGFLPADE